MRSRRATIIHFVILSTPFCRPNEQMLKQTRMTANVAQTMSTGLLITVPNTAPSSSALLYARIEPSAYFIKYISIQPEIVV